MNVEQILGGVAFFESVIDAAMNGEASPPAEEEELDIDVDGGLDAEFHDLVDDFEDTFADRESVDGGVFDDEEEDELDIFSDDGEVDGGEKITIGSIARMIGGMLENYSSRLI